MLEFVLATFQPTRTDDLRYDADKYIGLSTVWQSLWVIEDGPYAGQEAWTPYDLRYTFGWVPACDLHEPKPLTMDEARAFRAAHRGTPR